MKDNETLRVGIELGASRSAISASNDERRGLRYRRQAASARPCVPRCRPAPHVTLGDVRREGSRFARRFTLLNRHTGVSAALVLMLCVLPRVANAQDCGGQDQRACCIFETGFTCRDGLTPVLGCSGNCQCSNFASGIDATQTCRLITACGADGERACCNGAGEFAPDGPTAVSPCNSGLTQTNGCSGNCWCGGAGPAFGEQAIGNCVQITPCGGEGDRACCNGAGEFSNDGLACNSGLVQIPGCDESTGNCYCPIGIEKSLGTCVQPGPCGGKGQRACCILTLETSNNGGVCDYGECIGDVCG